MTYSKTSVKKMIFHFDTPLGKRDEIFIPDEVANEIENFRDMCDLKKGRIGFSNNNIFDRKRLEVSCEEEPMLKTNS